MLVGRALPRREDERMLRGRAAYIDDMRPDGLLHIAFVRSHFARARIASISAPGVTLITAADLAGRTRPVPLLVPPGVEVADAEHPLLADGEVRYVGQPVAAVVAGARSEAEGALRGGRGRARGRSTRRSAARSTASRSTASPSSCCVCARPAATWRARSPAPRT